MLTQRLGEWAEPSWDEIWASLGTVGVARPSAGHSACMSFHSLWVQVKSCMVIHTCCLFNMVVQCFRGKGNRPGLITSYTVGFTAHIKINIFCYFLDFCTAWVLPSELENKGPLLQSFLAIVTDEVSGWPTAHSGAGVRHGAHTAHGIDGGRRVHLYHNASWGELQELLQEQPSSVKAT